MTQTTSGVTIGNVAVFSDVNGDIRDSGVSGSLAGSVTGVSVTTHTGVSGTVATPNTTPAISITLGAITPSSVAATGAVSGSNLSGTNTGDQTITLTGGVTGTGTGSFAATVVTNANLTGDITSVGNATSLANTVATGKLLTGFVSGSGTVSATDSILSAIQKVNGNTALLTGAVIYTGTWNANTNTPTLVSSTGTKGTLYKVSVAGSTSIDGITQWNVGDSIVFNGAVWDKIDGLANEVISVAGRTGVVTLAQTDVSGTVASTTTVNGHALSSNVVVSASDLTTGTLPAAQLPNPTASTLGGVQSIAAVSNNFLTSISTSGVPTQAQPSFTNISGTVASAQLPTATTSTLGAVEIDGTSIKIAAGVISSTQGLVRESVNLQGNAASAAATAAWTADEIIVETTLGGAPLKLTNTNSLSFNGGGTGANGMDTGAMPTSGNLYIYIIYNPNTTAVRTLGTIAGSGSSIYGGANMPSGFTYSALLWSGVTNSSAQFYQWQQWGNKVGQAPATALSAHAGVTSFTSANLQTTPAAPANAHTVSGYISQSQTTATAQQLVIASTGGGSVGLNNQYGTSYTSTGTLTGNTTYLNFDDVALVSGSSNIAYQTGNTTAASTSIFITGYTF